MRVPSPFSQVLLAVLSAAFVACGPTQSQPSPDAGAEATDAGPLPDCDVQGMPSTVTMGPGEKRFIALTATPAVTGVVLASTPSEVDALQQQPLGLLIEGPYVESEVPLRIEWSCGERAGAAQATVTLRPLTWTQLAPWTEGTTGPPGREYFSMLIDELNPDRLLVFGGFHYEPAQFTPANDLWELDLTTEAWTQLSSPMAPKLPGGTMVKLPGGQQALFLGGLQGNDTPYSLLRFDYAPGALTWTPEPVATGTGRGDYQPGFMRDSKRGRFLSVCGANSTVGAHCDVRAFIPGEGGAGGTWEDVPVAPGAKPVGRNGHFYVLDEQTDRIIVFAGDRNGAILQDTWALELGETPARWVKLFGTLTPPIGRRNGSTAYDPVNHRMLVWGGTPNGASAFPGVYFLDLDRGQEAWNQAPTLTPPPPRSSGAAVFDAPRSRFLMGFGNSELGVHVDLWALEL